MIHVRLGFCRNTQLAQYYVHENVVKVVIIIHEENFSFDSMLSCI